MVFMKPEGMINLGRDWRTKSLFVISFRNEYTNTMYRKCFVFCFFNLTSAPIAEISTLSFSQISFQMRTCALTAACIQNLSACYYFTKVLKERCIHSNG